MDFTQLVSEVYSLTNRPDLEAETLIAVKSATLKAHSSDNYFKDLIETIIQFTSSEYYQTLEYRTVIPRYRSLEYIAKFDVTNLLVGKELVVITPDLYRDSYGCLRTDVCYVAGNVIQIRSCTQEQYYSISCWVHPEVATEETYSSWIALEFPYAIVFEATAKILGSLEDEVSKNYYRGLALEEYINIRMHNTVAKGS